MKQKLLLALFVLFASVGAMRAAGDVTLTIPSGEKVTVTVNNATGITLPIFTGNSVTLIGTGGEQTIAGGNYTTLSISGKVSDCIAAQISITNLTFTNNGELKTLDVSALGALTNLNVSGNKLTPNASYNANGRTVTWGTQTVDISSVLPISANTGVKMTNTFGTQLAYFTSGTSTYTWTKYNSTSKKYESTSEANKNGILVDEFYFYNPSTKVYTDGTYQCTVNNGGVSIVLQGIKIAPAEVKLEIVSSGKSETAQEMGKIDGGNAIAVVGCSNAANGTIPTHTFPTYHQGDLLQISASANTNYVFDSFDEYTGTGLTKTVDVQPGASMATFKVEAMFGKTPKIRAVFKGEPQTINYTKAVTGGSFVIANSQGKEVVTGSSVEYGKKLSIQASPEKDYTPYYRINDGTGTAFTNNQAKIDVDQNLSIAVYFTKKAAPNYLVIIEGAVPATAIESQGITIGETKLAANAGSGTKEDPYRISSSNIPPNKTTNINITTGDGYVVTKVQLGTASLALTANKNLFSASFIAPEDNDATITISVAKQQKVEVYDPSGVDLVTGTPTAQTYIYDGNTKALRYTTNPNGLLLDIWYKLASQTNTAAYTKTAPTNVGDYDVKFSRKADNNYSAIADKEHTQILKINAANVEITTVPSVSVTTSGSEKVYSIGTGVAKFNNLAVTGKFEVVNNNDDVVEKVPTGTAYEKTHLVNLRFTALNGTTANNNFETATIQVPAKVGNTSLATYNIVVSDIPTGVTVEMYNGATKITGKNVPSGTGVTLVATVDGYSTVKFKDKSIGSSTEITTTSNGNVFTANSSITIDENKEYTVVLSGALTKQYTITAATQSYVYSGEAKSYVPYEGSVFDLVIKKSGSITSLTSTELDAFLKKYPITYLNASGQELAGAPVEAGNYTISINIPAGTEVGYKAQKFVSDKSTLQITKKDAAIVWPTNTTMVGQGHTLSASSFTGGSADVAGTFSWEDGTISPKNGEYYTIVFTPSQQYIGNYNSVKLTAATQKNDPIKYANLVLKVSEKPVISIASVQNGEIIVKDSKGIQYHSGNLIAEGTKLTITANPNDGFVLKSVTINGDASNGEYTVGKSSIEIVGTFELKSLVDPNTQYTVTLPTKNAVKGVVVNKPGINAVKKDAAFSFTLSHLAIDRPIVKANEVVLTPSAAGVYSIAKVAANTTVTVALAAPTKIKVGVEKITKNSKGFKLGSVQVQGLAADSSCYYGDVITLVAFPESGVTFHSWSDVTNADNPRSVTVTTAMTIKPQFTGTPTGIADIEGTKVYGAEGYIYVSCEGQATVTVVTMDGRSQQVRIAGEARIETGAGIYGVILQQGTEVLKTKVVVR